MKTLDAKLRGIMGKPEIEEKSSKKREGSGMPKRAKDDLWDMPDDENGEFSNVDALFERKLKENAITFEEEDVEDDDNFGLLSNDKPGSINKRTPHK